MTESLALQRAALCPGLAWMPRPSLSAGVRSDLVPTLAPRPRLCESQMNHSLANIFSFCGCIMIIWHILRVHNFNRCTKLKTVAAEKRGTGLKPRVGSLLLSLGVARTASQGLCSLAPSTFTVLVVSWDPALYWRWLFAPCSHGSQALL